MTLLLCLLLPLWACSPEREPGEHWVTAGNGLRMRAEPNREARRVLTIPFGRSVEVVDGTSEDETIQGVTGRWARVTYSGQTGWVFDPYLKQYNFLELKSVAAAHYRALLEKEHPGTRDFPSLARTAKQTADDIRILRIVGDLYLIEYWYTTPTSPDDDRFKAVWQRTREGWHELGGHAYKAFITPINDDDAPDVVLYSGCCVSYKIDLLLAEPAIAGFRPLEYFIEGSIDFKLDGRCKDARLVHERLIGDRVPFHFDCQSEHFVDGAGAPLRRTPRQ